MSKSSSYVRRRGGWGEMNQRRRTQETVERLQASDFQSQPAGVRSEISKAVKRYMANTSDRTFPVTLSQRQVSQLLDSGFARKGPEGLIELDRIAISQLNRVFPGIGRVANADIFGNRRR